MKINPMKVRVIFYKAGEKIVSWPKGIQSFPKLIRYDGRVYEHVTYDFVNEYGIDYECNFAEVKYVYGSDFGWESPVDLDVLLYPDGRGRCQCGARKLGYRDGTKNHSWWCPVYKDTDNG